MSETLQDEILSLNAIYAPDTLTLLSSSPTTCSLLLPTTHSISLRLEFPVSYPDAPPSIISTQSVGDHVAKGLGQEAVSLARQILGDMYSPGAPCIYDLVEELSARLEQLYPSAVEDEADAAIGSEGLAHGQEPFPSAHAAAADDDAQSASGLEEPPEWTVSEVVTEKKSVFVARAARVESTEQARGYVRYLIASDRKVARATHNMTAWRIKGRDGAVFQDCDDDGETAAGGRLLHLLQLMDVWDVMVVVTRWYGGVQLGPDRFRIINSVARDAAVKGGFVKESTKGKESKKGKK
ncbi:hypothetical protein CAC42_180 [Sphaceloma murrayae]|uniref:RWD domain-containing protein n=1 Tax=Sphaceloma murrayae TaxID=2082308 RepID=A0A2K1QMT8_9PEZI|nr:hypothetical protein CAC42_180 [Sphaceloma murrayae]